MKFTLLINASMLAAISLTSVPALAQSTIEPGITASLAPPAMTDGEVRRIDKETGKITIKHGEIKHMEMPGMTMIFVVKDKALLDRTSVGAKIQFMVTNENGQLTITDLQPT